MTEPTPHNFRPADLIRGAEAALQARVLRKLTDGDFLQQYGRYVVRFELSNKEPSERLREFKSGGTIANLHVNLHGLHYEKADDNSLVAFSCAVLSDGEVQVNAVQIDLKPPVPKKPVPWPVIHLFGETIDGGAFLARQGACNLLEAERGDGADEEPNKPDEGDAKEVDLRIVLIIPGTDHIVADSLDLTGRTAAEFSDQFADSGRTAARYLAAVNGLAQGDDHDAMRFVENVTTVLMARSTGGGLDAYVVDHDNRDGKAIRADSMFLGFMEAYRSGQS